MSDSFASMSVKLGTTFYVDGIEQLHTNDFTGGDLAAVGNSDTGQLAEAWDGPLDGFQLYPCAVPPGEAQRPKLPPLLDCDFSGNVPIDKTGKHRLGLNDGAHLGLGYAWFGRRHGECRLDGSYVRSASHVSISPHLPTSKPEMDVFTLVTRFYWRSGLELGNNGMCGAIDASNNQQIVYCSGECGLYPRGTGGTFSLDYLSTGWHEMRVIACRDLKRAERQAKAAERRWEAEDRTGWAKKEAEEVAKWEAEEAARWEAEKAAGLEAEAAVKREEEDARQQAEEARQKQRATDMQAVIDPTVDEFVELCLSGDLQQVRTLLQEWDDRGLYEIDIDHAASYGGTAMYAACSHGHSSILKELLRARASVHLRNAGGRSCLHAAAIAGEAACVQLLLEAGAEPNCLDKWGQPALLSAARAAHANCVQALLDGHAIDIHQRSYTAAVDAGHVKVAKLLEPKPKPMAMDEKEKQEEAMEQPPVPQDNSDGGQWVSRVTRFSSEYGGGWAADKVVGAPQVYPQYGDITGSWAPSARNGTVEFLELSFAKAVIIEEIHIYETFNPGAIIRVSVWKDSSWSEIWSGPPRQHYLPKQSRVFKPPLQRLMVPTNQVRLDMDTNASESWSEIDAVRLIPQRIFQPLVL